VSALARRWLHEAHGDEDLGGGDDLLSTLLEGQGEGKLPLDLPNEENLGGLLRELLDQLGGVGSP